ncbi:MAG: GntR family transcriptional regulator [Pseudomonadota bacterium]
MSVGTRPKTLRRKVYDSVREDLRQGKIGPDVLLVERELASALGVSRTPVREALYALEQDGFVRSTARGFQPRQLTDVEISHIFEMRQLLEPHAIANVAKSAGEGFEADLMAALDAQTRAHSKEDPAAFMAGNHMFRDAWLNRLANKRLAAAIALYDDHILSLRRSTLHDGAVRAVAIASLTAVLGAVAAKDEAAVLQRYKEHLDRAEAAMRATYN